MLTIETTLVCLGLGIIMMAVGISATLIWATLCDHKAEKKENETND